MSKDFRAIEFIKQKLIEQGLTVDTRPSTGFYDLFLKPNTYLLQPLLDDATALAAAQSIKEIENVNEDDADALIANLYITRRSGGKATGYARFYYGSTQDVTIPEGTVVLSESGNRFISTDEINVSKEVMALNIDGGYYYISIPFEADGYGTEYNVAAEAIIATEGGVSGVVKVSNPSAFSNGLSRETNVELKERARDAISTRNLLSGRSINTQLYDNFPAINNLLVIGFYDPEMLRDIVTTEVDGTVYQVHIGGCVDIYADTGVTGLTDAVADSTALSIIPASLYRKISATGAANSTTIFTDSSGDFINNAIAPNQILRIKSSVEPGDYTISSVDSATQLTTTETMNFTENNVAYEILDPNTPWESPIIQITQVDRLDPGSLTPSGIFLYDGRSTLVNPKIINEGSDPEIIVDGTNGIHCVFERESDVWYTKLSNAGLTEVPAFNVSSSISFARNPDLTLDSSGNISIVWESDDATAGKTDIYLCVQDADGTSVVAAAAVLADLALSYANASIADNPNGLNIVSIKDSTNLAYTLIDISDYSSILANEIPLNPGPQLGPPGLDVDSNYSYITVSTGADVYVLKVTSTGALAWSAISFSSGTTNTLPTIAIDSTSDIYVAWDSDGTSIYLAKTDELGVTVYSPTEMVGFNVGHVKSPRLVVDSSDKVHLAVINENLNSGDVNYLKFDSDLSPLVDVDLVQDQYNNANYVAIVVDFNRRPHILWDSYDNRTTNIYYTKRQSQDYRVVSLDENHRYSMQEIVNIEIDDNYASDYLRFSYEYESNMSAIDDYVRGNTSLDRVVNASYVVRYPVPCFIDITIEYTGDDSSAVDIITNYINNTTESSISTSELVAALPSSVAARVTLPFMINAETHNQDGSVTIASSENIIEEARNAKFIARNISSL